MKIDFLSPKGPQPTEQIGLSELRMKLPSGWKGYANLYLRNERRRGQDREIDVVLITPDRLILVDLKHIREHLVDIDGFEGGFRVRIDKLKPGRDLFPLLLQGRICCEPVFNSLIDGFGVSRDTSDHGPCLLGGVGFERLAKADPGPDCRKPAGQIGQPLGLPCGPIKPVAGDRSSDVDEMQTTRLGKTKRLPVEAAARIIERGLFGVSARQHLDEPARFGKGAAAVIDGKILAVARHCHIGQMPIEQEGGEHFHAINGSALALVHRRGVDEKSVKIVLQNLTHEAGFEMFTYVSLQANTHKILSNYPEVWQQRYLDELYVSVDPVMLGLRYRSDLFAWSNTTEGRLNKKQRKFFAEAAEFGIRSGVSIPVRSGFGQMAMLTLASSEHGYAESRSITPSLAAAAVGQMHARIDILELKPRLHAPVELTPGQLTCLRWNAEGKTADDIADIEKTSAHNVRFHLKGAKRALGASTLTQAARIATILGLI